MPIKIYDSDTWRVKMLVEIDITITRFYTTSALSYM